MKIRRIGDVPYCSGKYYVYHILENDSTFVFDDGTEKEHKAGTMVYNTIDIDDEDIKNWDEKSKELAKTWQYWGCPDFPENIILHNLSCSSCEFCIWTSHFKYCTQLDRELNNWFRINARLKDCPF